MVPTLVNDLSNTQAAAKSPAGWPSTAKLVALNKAVLSTCGAKAGVLENPPACRFDPVKLLCKPGQSETCLTDADLAIVRKVYAGAQDQNGRSMFPGYEYGGEDAWNWAIGSRLQKLPTNFFGELVVGNPNWDFRNLSPDAALAKSGRLIQLLDATNPDLSAFKAAGGKLIQYHGWSDPFISPQFSTQYYESVAAKMGGVENTRSFYRLFMAPGMRHCGGGPGPSAVGANAPAPSRDAQHDLVSALVRWTEESVPPDMIIATRYRDNSPSKGVEAQRPWCAYPAISRFSGHGDETRAASFACVLPKEK
jgi:feruloyl esterase